MRRLSDGERQGGVEYSKVDDVYFARRGLRRYARVGSLWALGVGAVISGDFFGWNFGLAAGGFGGLLTATAIITVMYAGLCFSIAEMSSALPHTGGAYSFARSSLGPWRLDRPVIRKDVRGPDGPLAPEGATGGSRKQQQDVVVAGEVHDGVGHRHRKAVG